MVRWGGSENGITCAKILFGEKKKECAPLSTFHVVPGIKRGNQHPKAASDRCPHSGQEACMPTSEGLPSSL